MKYTHFQPKKKDSNPEHFTVVAQTKRVQITNVIST